MVPCAQMLTDACRLKKGARQSNGLPAGHGRTGLGAVLPGPAPYFRRPAPCVGRLGAASARSAPRVRAQRPAEFGDQLSESAAEQGKFRIEA